MPRDYWNFYSAGRVVFGQRTAPRVAEFLRPWRRQRLLVVTDAALVAAGVVDTVVEPLRQAGLTVTVFEGGAAEPSFAVADEAWAAAQAAKPEIVLGLGGGSNMDLAKFIAVLATHGGSYRDYFGFDRVPGPVLPLVCLPTTAGTGSEVSHAAVLTDTAAQNKVSMLSHYIRPALAVVDPCLTLSCPPKATADSGIDALTHAIEAFTAARWDEIDVPANEPFPYDGKQPLGDCLAERAIELVRQHLQPAVHEPQNLVAREGMALAALMAGLAFSNNAVAAVHALEYPLGGALHVSHGAGNGLLLPHLMRFNLATRTPELARVGRLLKAATFHDSDPDAAAAGIAKVETLLRAIGIPTRIRDLGGTRDQLPGFADMASQISRLMRLNGRPLTRDQILEIYEAAF